LARPVAGRSHSGRDARPEATRGRSDHGVPTGTTGEDLALLSRLREAAEQAKIRLSTETEIEITLPFLTPDFSFQCRLSRAELEQITRDLIERTRSHCLRSLADAKLRSEEH